MPCMAVVVGAEALPSRNQTLSAGGEAGFICVYRSVNVRNTHAGARYSVKRQRIGREAKTLT